MSLLYFVDMIWYYLDDTVTNAEPSDKLLQLFLGFIVAGASFLHLFQQQQKLIDTRKLTIAGCISALAVLIAANLSFNTDPLVAFDITLIYGYGTAFCIQMVFSIFFFFSLLVSSLTVIGYLFVIASIGFLVLGEIVIAHVANAIYKNFWSEYTQNIPENKNIL